MSRSIRHRICTGLRLVLVTAGAVVAVAALSAETTVEYRYDEAGRLRGVVRPETDASYTLDAAGNRTSVTSAAGRGWPSSFDVPASSTGNYSISWGASTGSGNRYELYEATNSNFAGETLIHNVTNPPQLNLSFTSKPYNTYYYRIRVCDATGCGPRRTDNPIVVAPPPVPGVPGTMTIPTTDIDGTYAVSWIASGGTVTAYQLYEATQSNFSNETQVYSGAAASASLSGRGNGTFHYRVRACNGPSCSTHSVGGNPIVVTLTPATPSAVVAPFTYTNVGTYTLTWTPVGTVPVTVYELLENVLFGSESLIYSGPNTSLPITGRTHGARSYRLRACNGACSEYTATQGNGTVVVVDTVAPNPPTSLSKTGDFVLFWSGGSTDNGPTTSGVDRWRVYRSGTLAGTVLAPMQSFDDTAAPSNQTYTYTVRSVDRAGNESTNSPGLTFYVDNIPPAAPTNVTAVATSPQSITVSWTAAVDPLGGTITSQFVYRDGVGPILISGSATSFVDTPLSPSTTYTYTIKAWDLGSNESPLSVPASATTPALPPEIPAIPLNLRFVRPAGTKPNYHVYDVLWDASPPPPTVSYYVLEETLGGATWTYTINAPTTMRGFHQTVGGTYSYRVRSCTAVNVCSGYSPSISKGVCVGSGCNQ